MSFSPDNSIWFPGSSVMFFPPLFNPIIFFFSKKLKNNVKIYSDKITYFKNDELIYSQGNSKAISDNVSINADKFNFDQNLTSNDEASHFNEERFEMLLSVINRIEKKYKKSLVTHLLIRSQTCLKKLSRTGDENF